MHFAFTQNAVYEPIKSYQKIIKIMWMMKNWMISKNLQELYVSMSSICAANLLTDMQLWQPSECDAMLNTQVASSQSSLAEKWEGGFSIKA